jgi:hypothetical protein
MTQSRTDISFGDLGSGLQIGINYGPIHLPPGTSVTAKPDYANGCLPCQKDQRHHQVRRPLFHSAAILTTSIDRLC